MYRSLTNVAPGSESCKQLDDISSIFTESKSEKGPIGIGAEDIFRDAEISPAPPDLQSEVDEMLGKDSDERVAVVVCCGPAQWLMTCGQLWDFGLKRGEMCILIKRAFPCDEISVNWYNGIYIYIPRYIAEFRATDNIQDFACLIVRFELSPSRTYIHPYERRSVFYVLRNLKCRTTRN